MHKAYKIHILPLQNWFQVGCIWAVELTWQKFSYFYAYSDWILCVVEIFVLIYISNV
jgi:hypothetical protein